MIPWWGWIAIWAGLVLLLLMVLVVITLVLFRKAMRVLSEASTMASKLDILEPEVLELEPHDTAVLAEMERIRERYDAQRRRRESLRLHRRERRLQRARRITRLDPTTVKWPDSWTTRRG